MNIVLNSSHLQNQKFTFSLFHSNIIDVHQWCFSEKSVTRRYHIRKPWLTSCLTDAIRKKNKFYYESVKIELFELRKSMSIAINCETWWELQKGNITQIELWKPNKIKKKHPGRLSNLINENKVILKNKLNESSYTKDVKIICKQIQWLSFYQCRTIIILKSHQCKTAVRTNTWNESSLFFISWTHYRIWNERTEHSSKSSAPEHDNITSSVSMLSLPFIYIYSYAYMYI